MKFISVLGLLAVQRLVQRLILWLWRCVSVKAGKYTRWISWKTEIIIEEYAGGYYPNEVYTLAEVYMSSLISDSSRSNNVERIYFSQGKNASKPSYKPASGESINDSFEGVTFQWQFLVKQPDNRGAVYVYDKSERIQRMYIVSVRKCYKYTVLPRYMDYITKRSNEFKRQMQDRFLYTNIWTPDSGYLRSMPWKKVPFKHCATFESLALAPGTKQMIMDDLDSFMRGRDFFQRVGRAWKRGYLLFGPPGTGKTSLVAAIANYTQYDVYDLDLTEVKSNGILRDMLMTISNKAIIVMEDIDCSLELKKRGKPSAATIELAVNGIKKEDKERSRVTLSGLLNFIDGLWSCIETERIIIFTTNHKELLDPALLRTGRMDMQIHMPYCCFDAFKTLAWTYLSIKEHGLFQQTEELIQEVEITPADVAEIFIENKGDVDVAMERVVQALKKRKAVLDREEVPKTSVGEIKESPSRRGRKRKCVAPAV